MVCLCLVSSLIALIICRLRVRLVFVLEEDEVVNGGLIVVR